MSHPVYLNICLSFQLLILIRADLDSRKDDHDSQNMTVSSIHVLSISIKSSKRRAFREEISLILKEEKIISF